MNKFAINCPACDEIVEVPIGIRSLCPSCKAEIEPDIFYVVEQQNKREQLRIEQTKNILRNALKSKDAKDYWKELKAWSLLDDPMPAPPELLGFPAEPEFNEIEPTPPTYLEYLPEPNPDSLAGTSYDFENKYAVWAYDIKQTEAENQRRWNEHVAALERWNSRRIEHEKAVVTQPDKVKYVEGINQGRKNEYEAALEQWKQRQIEGEKSEAQVKAGYKLLEPRAVKFYCKIVLQFSNFHNLPIDFRRDYDLEYIPETKILVVDHALPAPDDLSRIKEVKFIESKEKFVEVSMSEREFDEMYDDALYQMCLRTIHELFREDTVDALDAIVFNGWIESVDKATGNDTKACVLSVQVKKEEFQKINLARVEPKACFKALKGIGSSTLHSLTPIAPVLKINREDKRFVASYEIAGQLDERTNLAAMDWEDFEHLIREIFEKEFSTTGGEVKVTQASRDGGVDAVVFDPDPIRGGKTIIQAKRYTNTVGVAAVRELYGTVLNEGAMKGILVTTADYGPDAYEFAQGKPLVLLNGANLLHLLEKHGHKAKIDIKEAKRILGEKA